MTELHLLGFVLVLAGSTTVSWHLAGAALWLRQRVVR